MRGEQCRRKKMGEGLKIMMFGFAVIIGTKTYRLKATGN